MGLITGCSLTLVSSAVLFFPNGWLGLTRSKGKYSWMARSSSKASLILSSRPILKRPSFLGQFMCSIGVYVFFWLMFSQPLLGCEPRLVKLRVILDSVSR